MHTDIVLDSTALAAIFFNDPYSDKVEAALKNYGSFYTLDLAFAEVGNVAWKRTTLFKEDYTTNFQALAAASDFITKTCKVTESKQLLQQALAVGSKHQIPLYDALFLVLASTTRMALLTTDETLHRKVSHISDLKGLTILPSPEIP